MGRHKKVPPSEQFAEWLRAKGYSTKLAGKKLGISSAWVSYIARGIKVPGSPWLRDTIERVIGIPHTDWPIEPRKPRAKKVRAEDPV